MSTKIWEVKEGRIISLRHTNVKGENRLVILKEPMDYDSGTLISELGKALDLMNTYIASVQRIKDDLIDTIDTIDTKDNIKDNVVPTKDNVVPTKDNVVPIIESEVNNKDIECNKGHIEDVEKTETRKSLYHRTDRLLRKLKAEIKPNAEVNTHEIAKILELTEKNLLYHLNKWINSGDITKVGHMRYKILEKDTRLASPDKIIQYQKDLYGR